MSRSIITTSKLQLYLPIAGALPFVAAAMLTILGVSLLPWGGSVMSAVMTYGLIIASFMAGAHWGQQLSLAHSLGSILAILSNGIALALWVAFLSGQVLLMIITLAVALVVLLAVDIWLNAEGVIQKQYLRVRAIVTMIVVSSLGVLGAQL